MKYTEMTDKELEDFIEETYDMIYGNNACYNVKDLMNLDNALQESKKRGIFKLLPYKH